MLRTIETFIREGKPLPLISCDRIAPANTLVPSKKEAQLALDRVMEILDAIASPAYAFEAIKTLQRFLDTR